MSEIPIHCLWFWNMFPNVSAHCRFFLAMIGNVILRGTTRRTSDTPLVASRWGVSLRHRPFPSLADTMGPAGCKTAQWNSCCFRCQLLNGSRCQLQLRTTSELRIQYIFRGSSFVSICLVVLALPWCKIPAGMCLHRLVIANMKIQKSARVRYTEQLNSVYRWHFTRARWEGVVRA